MAELPDAPWAAPKPELPDAPWAQPANFDQRFKGQEQEPIPQPFLQRLAMGHDVERRVKQANQSIDAIKEGFGSEPLGWSDQHVKELMDYGWLHDPASGTPSPLRLLGDSLVYGVPKVADAVMRGVNAGLHFTATKAEQLAGDVIGDKNAAGISKEMVNFGNYLMVDGMAKVSRPHPSGEAAEQVVGSLPKAEDFKAAAEASGAQEANLRTLWQERGIHPAEAAHDAESDAFLKHDLATPPAGESANRVGDTNIGFGSASMRAYREQLSGQESSVQAAERRIAEIKPIRIPQDFSLEKGEAHQFADGSTGQRYRISGPDGPTPAVVDVELRDAGKTLDITWVGHDEKSAGQLNLGLSGGRELLAKLREIYPDATRVTGSRISGAKRGEIEMALPRINDEELQLLEQAGVTPHSLGAAANTEPPLVPIAEQPASPPGRLMAAGREAVEQLTGLGRNIQFMLDPMATGSARAMVITKDAINSVRRIRWDHARIDDAAMTGPELKAARERTGETVFEQHERMWNAADEESVARQLGEKTEHQGLATLEPEERAFIEDAHARAQAAWLHAQDAGIVESEGLPAYTPRMVMNVAAAGEHLGPRALNELGRNVFTRTSQMLHRKHLTAEATEAAAKELVGDRMAKRGASVEEISAAMEKVQIARNIRALPLATARLEEAAIWREMINKIDETGKATGQETLAVGFKPDSTWFTIAGHPAFTKWEPALEKNPVTGKWGTRTDDAGNVLFVPKPMYMPAEFKGPMHAILDEGSQAMKAVPGAMSAYEGLMAIKGKAMTAILNSPLIHNEVVWSKVMEAAGGREWLGFGLYFRGNRIVNNPARAGELIERGLSPMGKRGSFQDITAMMEEPSLTAGRSWTAKIAAAIPGLFDPAAELAVKQAVDKAGDFWHNTLLWDRVRDVQFGLADHLSDRLVAKGADRLTADRIATHFSNIIVGSIPKEAMSAGARAAANLLLFSRSFTLGNLSTFKQAALGLPKPILAQIERDFGISAAEAIGEDAAASVKQTAQSIARRKAISTIMMSAGLYYVGNALLQHGFNIAARDSTIEEEMNGYARRYESLMTDASKDPFELRHIVGRLSPTYDNEPGKSDRAHIGYDKDGTAIYARNPTGKFGEEMVGYPTMPLEMIRRKLSPMAGGILDVMENDKGFGRKIYDPNDTTVAGDIQNAFAIGKHLVMKHLPEGQIMAAGDLLRGDGDPTVNKLRLFGPAAGFTASVGAPGGMARGEQLTVKSQSDIRFNLAWPDIKKQIQRGDEEGAREAMDKLGLSKSNQGSLIRSATNPAGQLKGRTLQDFLQKATPEQRERFERARSAP